MDIETDCETIDGRVDVIAKTCIRCGVKYVVTADKFRRKLCDACKAEAERKHKRAEAAKAVDSTTELIREQERKRAKEAALRKERQRQLDADYARFERENGIRAVVEDHGTCIVEIRGQLCCGWGAVGRVIHD